MSGSCRPRPSRGFEGTRCVKGARHTTARVLPRRQRPRARDPPGSGLLGNEKDRAVTRSSQNIGAHGAAQKPLRRSVPGRWTDSKPATRQCAPTSRLSPIASTHPSGAGDGFQPIQPLPVAHRRSLASAGDRLVPRPAARRRTMSHELSNGSLPALELPVQRETTGGVAQVSYRVWDPTGAGYPALSPVTGTLQFAPGQSTSTIDVPLTVNGAPILPAEIEVELTTRPHSTWSPPQTRPSTSGIRTPRSTSATLPIRSPCPRRRRLGTRSAAPGSLLTTSRA
jgi:hypothetical protein